MDTKKLGILSILGASLMWAIEPIFAKLSYFNSDFLHTAAVRVFFVALVALIYVFITNRGNLRVNKKQFSAIVYLAIVGTIFADMVYLFTLTKLPVVNVVLIGHLQPIFIVLIGFFVLKEDKLTRFDYFGIFLMVIASLLVTTKSFVNFSVLRLGTVWDLFLLLSTLGWATTTIVARKYLRGVNAGVLTFYRSFFALILIASYLFMTSYVAISNSYQVVVGILTGVGTILYYEGLKRIKAAQVSSLELSTPFFAALFGFLVLKEVVTVMQILGIVLLVIGVYFLSKKEEAYF